MRITHKLEGKEGKNYSNSGTTETPLKLLSPFLDFFDFLLSPNSVIL